MLDYNKLAKRKNLEIQADNLNRAREKTLDELSDLGVKMGETSELRGAVDQTALEQELTKIAELKNQTKEWLQQQEVNDVLNQAREGSRLAKLERRLQAEPELLQEMDLSDLQQEQINYQRRALEIVDYLAKYFSQFTMEMKVELPDAGVRFFDEVATNIQAKMQMWVEQVKELQIQIAQEQKKLQKNEHQEQRILHYLQDEIGEQLEEKDYALGELLTQNSEYQDLLREVADLKVLIKSQLNEINFLLSETIEFLTQQKQVIASVVSQNRVTREILAKLKTNENPWQLDELKKKIAAELEGFDGRVTEVLLAEMDKRFERQSFGEQKKEEFLALVEEIIDFQEYLGQIFADSLQVIQSNCEDLADKRADFGKLVLDEMSQKLPIDT